VDKKIVYQVETTAKTGTGDLHDFAVPELGEKLEVVIDEYAQVYKAGDYPKDSVFYLPPVSLPKDAVTIGDTWVFKGQWITLTNRVPLEIETVSILTDVIPCERGLCAVIELSGEVKIFGVDLKEFNLSSRVRGVLIFSIDLGAIVWSHVISEQSLISQGIRAESKSCLASTLLKPEWKKLREQAQPFCKAESEFKDIIVPTNL
jgi:hypothetical protein